MAVRELDGVDDEIQTATGGLSALTYGTLALLVKRLTVDANHAIVAPHTSGGTGSGLRAGWSQFNDTVLIGDGGDSVVGSVGTANVWRLYVWRKGTGSATPRLSTYNFDTATWSHGNGNAAMPDGVAPSTTGTIRFGIGQFQGRGHYRIAAAAYWSNNVRWATDATGDLNVELAGLEDAYQKWIDATPSAAWKFNQASTGTAIVDNTGGGADQSAITGTTVVTTDDPPAFDFTLGGGGATVLGAAVLAASGTLAATGQATSTGAAALSAAGTLAAAATATSSGAAVMSASGTLAADGKATTTGATSLTATSTMTASTGSTKGAVSMTATATLGASPQVRSFAAATLAAAATLGAAATPRSAGAAALTGTGTLTVTAAGTAFAAAVLAAIGTLGASGRVVPPVPPHPAVLTLAAIPDVLTLESID